MTRTRPDVPERLTWDELEKLPEEVSREIELWEGRVVWVRSAPSVHQLATSVLWSALRRCNRDGTGSGECFTVNLETNVFFGHKGRSDFSTPDFLIFRCLADEFDWPRASDVVLVGEVLSKSNTEVDIEAKKARYAKAGIPWYWEVRLARDPAHIASIRAYVLEKGHADTANGVHPLRASNYLVAAEWTPDGDAISIDYPFPIRIAWDELVL